jgi:hypothetical protein
MWELSNSEQWGSDGVEDVVVSSTVAVLSRRRCNPAAQQRLGVTGGSSWNPTVLIVFISARRWSLFLRQRNPDFYNNFLPHFLGSILLSCNQRQGLPSGLFPSGSVTYILYAFVICCMRATSPAHPSSICWSVKLMKFLIVQLSPAAL